MYPTRVGVCLIGRERCNPAIAIEKPDPEPAAGREMAVNGKIRRVFIWEPATWYGLVRATLVVAPCGRPDHLTAGYPLA
jgi:hypothetical protein